MTAEVPRFASFRPKLRQTSLPTSKASDQAVEKQGNESKRNNRRDDGDKLVFKRVDEAEKVVKSSQSRNHFSDRRGDVNIARYGLQNQHEVPSFRRIGGGCVLGLSKRQKIDRALSSNKAVYIIDPDHARQKRLLLRRPPEHLAHYIAPVPDPEAHAPFAEHEFIQVSASGKTRRRQAEGDLEDHTRPTKTLDHSEDSSGLTDSNAEDSVTDSARSIHAPIQKQNLSLTQKTRTEPQNLRAWLDLIHYQRLLLDPDAEYDHELSISKRRDLALVRISLYEESIKRVGSAETDRIVLFKGLLSEAQHAWDGFKLVTKWNDVLEQYPQSWDLWSDYLNHVQSSLKRFKYESCLSIYFKTLAALCKPAKQSSATILHIIVRMTTMIHESGYQELSVAVWQALLEYTLLSPSLDEEASKFQQQQSFENFWESEVPRVGEIGCKGWKHYDPDATQSSASKEESSVILEATDIQQASKLEAAAVQRLRYPGRTSDDVAEDDAFHTIFHSDVTDYISIIPSSSSIVPILDAFLSFAGLPALPRDGVAPAPWRSDPLLQHHSISNTLSDSASTSGRTDLLSSEGFSMTSDLLFEQEFALDHARLDEAFVRRILNLLAVEHPSEEIIAEYLLAFDLAHHPADIAKTAKRLLKNRPSSLRLYYAYGLAELKRGNVAKSDQVFTMALSMSGTDSEQTSREAMSIFYEWVWSALETQTLEIALSKLSSYGSNAREKEEPNTELDHSSISQAESCLGKATEQALLRHDHMFAITGTSLLALLAYLTHNTTLEPALTAHKQLTSWLNSHSLLTSPIAEIHAQFIARLLTFYLSKTPLVPPTLIRTTLEPLLHNFPHNSILLSLYARNEARFSIHDRVRGVFHQPTLQNQHKPISSSMDAAPQSIASHLLTITHELARRAQGSSTSHAVRAAFTRATAPHASGAHNLALWQSYMAFELEEYLDMKQRAAKSKASAAVASQHGNADKEEKKISKRWRLNLASASTRLKDTVHAALRHLPWCKDVVMFALTDASEVFSEEELRGLWEVMHERELRVYVEMESGARK